MPSDIYLTLKNIKGESQDEDHKDEIEISSWSWGVSNPASREFGTGGGVGRAQFQNVTVTKYTDLSTTNLAGFCATNKDIATAVISCYKAAGEKRVKYLEITLEQCSISDFGISCGGHDIAQESAAIAYAKILMKYTPQEKDQAGGGGLEFEHDVTKHK